MNDFTALLVAVGPLALLVTKAVDFLRNAFDKDDTRPKWFWNIAAFAVGTGYCLLFEVNLVGTVQGLSVGVVERLGGSWGQIATGLAIGGFASFWHEQLDKLSTAAETS